MLGKVVNTFQSNVSVSNGKATGDLTYVEGWTEFSGDPEKQNGYYVCIHWSNPDAHTTSIKINGVEAFGDPDQNHVQRLSDDPRKNKLKIVQKDAAGHENIQIIDLSGLNMLPVEDEELEA